VSTQTPGSGGSAFFTIAEAAAFLGISRALADESAKQFIEGEGRSGLRFVRIGHRVLVPRSHLERLAGGGAEQDTSAEPSAT